MSTLRWLAVALRNCLWLLLMLLAFLPAVFYLGTQANYATLVREHFWATLALRFGIGLVVGWGCTAGWWLLRLALIKAGLALATCLATEILLLATGPLAGAASGALLFCLH